MNAKEGNITHVVHRFKWYNNTTIQVINAEGLERIIELGKGDKLNELHFHNIPLYMSYWSDHNHYYYEKPMVELGNVNERLKRKYQTYKWLTHTEDKHAQEQRSGEEKLTQREKKFYQSLFSVDYLKPMDNANDDESKDKLDRFVIDTSFTFLSWNLVEQLQKGTLQVNQINKEQLKCLIYNIFPGGETILHMLANDGKLIEALYYGCHFYSDEEKCLKADLHLPFLKNF